MNCASAALGPIFRPAISRPARARTLLSSAASSVQRLVHADQEASRCGADSITPRAASRFWNAAGSVPRTRSRNRFVPDGMRSTANALVLLQAADPVFGDPHRRL